MTNFTAGSLRLLSCFIGLCFIAGCTSIPDPRITVMGSLHGEDGAYMPVESVDLFVTHQPDVPLPRVDTELHGMQDLKSVSMSVSESQGFPFDNEEFAFLSLSRGVPRVGEEESVVVELTADNLWVRRHRGDLAVLRLRKDDVSLPTTEFDDFDAAGMRPAGASWLARLESDDRRIPWIIEPAAGNCTAVPLVASLSAPTAGQTVDCFDLSTLANMFFANLAVTVVEELDKADLPVPVSAGQHRFYLVPHLELEGENDTYLGFGFLYEARISLNMIGAALATIKATVPISIHFVPVDPPGANPPRLELLIDPVGAPASTIPWANIDRVTVEYEDGPINGFLAEQVRQTVVDALSGFVLPPVAVASTELTAGEALSLLISMTAPRPAIVSPYPDDFNVIALPEQRVTLDATLSNQVLSYGSVTTSVTYDNLAGPAAPDMTGTVVTAVDAAGRVTKTTMINNTGTIRRVTTLFPVNRHTPFELVFLE